MKEEYIKKLIELANNLRDKAQEQLADSDKATDISLLCDIEYLTGYVNSLEI